MLNRQLYRTKIVTSATAIMNGLFQTFTAVSGSSSAEEATGTFALSLLRKEVLMMDFFAASFVVGMEQHSNE